MWNDRYGAAGLSLWARASFDPLTMTAMAATAVGGGIKAAGTLASGEAAKDAGELRAGQLRQNASQAIASGQRQMFDTQDRTKQAISTSTARAAASGVAADVGSPLENTGELAQRGGYQALMDMFNGESAASGLRNQASVAEWEGRAKRKASYLAAGADVASTLGSMTSTYGKFAYPTSRGGFGA